MATLATRPSREALAAITNSASAIIAKVDDPRRLREYLGYHRDRLALDYEWMRATGRGSDRICDLGAAPFVLTRALLDSGFDVQAATFPTPDDSAFAAAAGVSAAFCNIETQPLPFPDSFFDHVLLNEVFEHLRIDLIFTTKEILRVLRPGGRLWLSTPNLRSFRGIFNLVFKGQAYSSVGEGLYHVYQGVHGGGSMGHVREYTSTEVASFLAAVGFLIEDVIYRGEYRNPALRLLSAIAPGMKPYFSVVARRK